VRERQEKGSRVNKMKGRFTEGRKEAERRLGTDKKKPAVTGEKRGDVPRGLEGGGLVFQIRRKGGVWPRSPEGETVD